MKTSSVSKHKKYFVFILRLLTIVYIYGILAIVFSVSTPNFNISVFEKFYSKVKMTNFLLELVLCNCRGQSYSTTQIHTASWNKLYRNEIGCWIFVNFRFTRYLSNSRLFTGGLQWFHNKKPARLHIWHLLYKKSKESSFQKCVIYLLCLEMLNTEKSLKKWLLLYRPPGTFKIHREI